MNTYADFTLFFLGVYDVLKVVKLFCCTDGIVDTDGSPSAAPCPRKKEPPFTDGRFASLARFPLEGLHVSERMVLSVRSRRWKPNDSQEELVVSRSKLGGVLRPESPRHTPVQQGLDHLGLQHADVQTRRGGRPNKEPRAKPFEAFPPDADPSVDFEREVNVSVHDAHLGARTGPSVYTSGLLLRW